MPQAQTKQRNILEQGLLRYLKEDQLAKIQSVRIEIAEQVVLVQTLQ